ncbi:fluoride efflux transporter CrcB [Pontibacillus sp. ALD_SL1]|uniref:fluoride efflux transporter CrcB n=1 Tax=Pontibacillus sp. ALD_SL1 TaxID=2777185 RepID=UPI001A97D001|nr:fluoride efflux transporter CrcB [Pontibacillus sp. ALD_SL1]QSS99474.1 fluoride efflux transporter CrcB [Pontibacillus sp. ALD_SL1]
MSVYLAIFIGGALGASGRFMISLWIEEASVFPYETLLVNLIGCFILTYLSAHPTFMKGIPSAIKVGISTGIIGAFTTFSTFSTETVQLWIDTSQTLAVLYVVASLAGGLVLSWLGFFTANNWKGHAK